MEYYRPVFAAHLLAVAVFGSGVLLTSLMLPSFRREGARSPEAARELGRLWVWTLYGTTPALCLVWLFGVTLALSAGWFAALWLQIKLGLVAGLSIVHFVQVRAIWRMRCGRAAAGVSYWTPLLISVLLIGIVALAGAKPM